MDVTDKNPDVEPCSLADNAVQLGTSLDADRKRFGRGTIRAEKRVGRWFVCLPSGTAPSTDRDATQDTPPAVRELLKALRHDNRCLRSVPESRTAEIHRRDHIIGGLVERVKELPATVDVPQERVPGPEQCDQPALEAESAMKTPAAGTAGAWRRWWRRVTSAG